MTEQLFRRNAGYAYKWLIKINKGENNIYLINDTKNCIYDNQIYEASNFIYAPDPEQLGFTGGGSLEITTLDNNLIYFLESEGVVKVEIVGVMIDGDVQPIEFYNHVYCSVTWDARKANFQFEPDDRLDMTFPALIFSHYNNRGNA
jgi:hypothetical protein